MSSTRARIIVAGTALAAVVAAPAAGAAPRAQLRVTVTPKKAGTPAKPRRVGLSLRLSLRATGSTPTIAATELHLPPQLRLIGRRFRACTLARLNNGGPRRCPRRSRVGSGRATALVAGQQQPIALRIYNGRRGRSLLLYLRAAGIVGIAQAIELPLTASEDPAYGRKLTLELPRNLLSPLPSLHVSMIDIAAKLRATRTIKRKRRGARRRGFVELTGCPADRRLPFKGVASFAGARPPSPLTVTTAAACRS